MDEEALDEAAPLVGTHGVQAAEGKDDERHDEKDGNAVKEAADEEVRFEEVELPTGEAIDGCRRIGDEVVKKYAEDPHGDAALECGPAEQACSDGSWDAPAVRDEGRGEIERAGEEAAEEDWQKYLRKLRLLE